jgi:Zn-dependent protease
MANGTLRKQYGLGLSANFMPILAVLLASGLLLFNGWLDKKFAVFAFVIAGWLASLCLHEFGHAFAAWMAGDDTMAAKGYLQLDPLKYADPVNSVLLPVIFIAMGAIAFPGGSVLIETRLIRSRAWLSMVSFAGPLMNILVLFAICIPFWLGLDDVVGDPLFWAALAYLGVLQVMAIVLNLLPLPGLDGFGIAAPYLPYSVATSAYRIAPVVPFALLIAFMAVPPFSQAFFRFVFSVSGGLGIDFNSAIMGMRAFRFWN